MGSDDSNLKQKMGYTKAKKIFTVVDTPSYMPQLKIKRKKSMYNLQQSLWIEHTLERNGLQPKLLNMHPIGGFGNYWGEQLQWK